MANRLQLSPPEIFDIHDSCAAEKWREWRARFECYSVATKLDQEEASVQVATLLTVIGAEAHKVFSTFHWTADEDKVLEKVLEYCQPRVNVPFERFKFNSRSQGAGEPFDLYVTTLRQLTARCNFAHVTKEDLLRDRIIFGIHNPKLKERLLREADLTLSKCLEICRAAELSSAQLKKVTRLNDSVTISAVNTILRLALDVR